LHELIVKVAEKTYGVDKQDADININLDKDQLPTLPDINFVVCGEVIEHLSNPGFFLDGLNKSYKCPVLLTVPNAFSSVGAAHYMKGYENVNTDHVAWYSWKTFTTLLTRHRFKVDAYWWYGGVPLFSEGLIFLAQARRVRWQTSKKNALNQILFTMVDATDFVSIESTLGAASVAGRFFGCNHGGSAATTSGALSKACSLVHSGIFRQTIKAAEANYDYVIYRFTATGCADQIYAFNTKTYDDTDTYSMLSDFYSDFGSRVPKAVAQASNLLLMTSSLSDVYSAVLLTQSLASDAHSAAAQANSRVLLNQSMLSDIDSAITSRFLIYTSDISDIKSALTALSDAVSNAHSAAAEGSSRALLNQSMLSDIDSAITSRFLIYTSDISDIKSALTALSDAVSNAYSAAVVGTSRITLTQSMVSDLDSALTSRFSDLNSFLGRLAYH